MLNDAQAKQKRGSVVAYRPPQALWSAEMEMLASIKDEIALLRLTYVSGHRKEGQPAPEFKPAPRPTSVAEAAEWERRRVGHDRVVAMMRSKDGTIPEEG